MSQSLSPSATSQQRAKTTTAAVKKAVPTSAGAATTALKPTATAATAAAARRASTATKISAAAGPAPAVSTKQRPQSTTIATSQQKIYSPKTTPSRLSAMATATPPPTPTTSSSFNGAGGSSIIKKQAESFLGLEISTTETIDSVLASIEEMPAKANQTIAQLNQAYQEAYARAITSANEQEKRVREFLASMGTLGRDSSGRAGRRTRVADENGVVPGHDWDELPWSRILWWFADAPGTIETLRGVCRDLRLVCSDARLRAKYFMLMGDKYLVFHEVYQRYPASFTTDVMACLLEAGAIIPKFLIERMSEDAQYWKSIEYECNSNEYDYSYEDNVEDDDDDDASTVVLMTDLQDSKVVSTIKRRSRVRRLPAESLEFCVSFGHKEYKDTLLIDIEFSADENEEDAADSDTDLTRGRSTALGGDSPAVASGVGPKNSAFLNHLAWTVDFESNQSVIHDDPYLFNTALHSAKKPNLGLLKKVLYNHGYTPALNPPSSLAEWDALWERMVGLLRYNRTMAWHVLDHCGCTRDKANDGIVSCVLRKLGSMSRGAFAEWTGVTSFSDWLEFKEFSVTEGVVLLVLASPDIVVLKEVAAADAAAAAQSGQVNGEAGITPAPAAPFGGEDVLSVLRANLDARVLEGYVEKALGILFRNGKRNALRTIDVLLTEFSIDEDTCARAFLAKPADEYVADHSRGAGPAVRVLPFMTALGQEQGGMIDMMWQLMLARYGAGHAFVAACVVDIVIGGTLKNPLTARGIGSIASAGRFNAMFSQPLVPTEMTLESDIVVVVGDDGLIKYKKSWTRARDELRARRQVIKRRRELEQEALTRANQQKALTLDADGINAFIGDTTVKLQEAGQKTRALLEGFSDRVLTATMQEKAALFLDHDDRDRDTAARDSLEALIDGAKVPIDPGMLGPISRGVLALKAARPRVLDFMARVEQNLIFATFHKSSTPQDQERWSKVRWISHLRRNILSSHAFLDKLLSPTELKAYEEQMKMKKPQSRVSYGVFSAPSFGRVLNTGGDNRRGGIVADRSTTPPASTAPASAPPSVLGSFSSVGKFVTRQVKAAATAVSGDDAGTTSAATNRRSVLGANSGSTGLNPTASMAVLANALKYATAVTSDIVDPEWMEVRRFYVACEDLVAVLEADGAPTGVGPFTKWLKEVDQKNIGVDFKEHITNPVHMLSLSASFALAVAVAASAKPSGKYFDNYIFVVMENTDIVNVLKNEQYASLLKDGVEFTNYHGVIHPSQPNYWATIAQDTYRGLVVPNITTGVNAGANSGDEGDLINGDNGDDVFDIVGSQMIADSLEAAGLSWGMYSEQYPGNSSYCFVGAGAGTEPTNVPGADHAGAKNRLYKRKHNPFMSFVSVNQNVSRCTAHVFSEVDWAEAVAADEFPDYIYFAPNQVDDAHDFSAVSDDHNLTEIALGMEYSASWFVKLMAQINASKYLSSRRTLVHLTFDEDDLAYTLNDDGAANCTDTASNCPGDIYDNQVYGVLLGTAVACYENSTIDGRFDHFSIVATLNDNWGLPALSNTNSTGAKPWPLKNCTVGYSAPTGLSSSTPVGAILSASIAALSCLLLM
ncbi:hypothetical protein HDU84_005715 [Entophlyctis sp. JEL0112]|nr:hypothetical protein HDU84_005715 [Entophlyctis sp. JEL0112]